MEFNQDTRELVRSMVLSCESLDKALDLLTNIGIDTDCEDLFHYTEDLRDMVIDKKELIWVNKG